MEDEQGHMCSCVCVRVGISVQRQRVGVYTDKRPLTVNHQGRHDDAMAMPTHGPGFETSSTVQAVGMLKKKSSNVLYLL